jgi:hypothetical protein
MDRQDRGPSVVGRLGAFQPQPSKGLGEGLHPVRIFERRSDPTKTEILLGPMAELGRREKQLHGPVNTSSSQKAAAFDRDGYGLTLAG